LPRLTNDNVTMLIIGMIRIIKNYIKRIILI